MKQPVSSKTLEKGAKKGVFARVSRISLITLLLTLMNSVAYGADFQDPRSGEIHLSTGEVAVASAGNLEPRNVGSYALRAYSAANPAFPYDDHIAGTVRPGDGTLESLAAHDLDRNGTEAIVVILRSAGTGSYLSAEAIQYTGKSLILIISVDGLEKSGNPIQALELAFKKGS